MVIINWPGLVIALAVLLPLGIVAIISPITVVRLFMIWPKFILPKLLGEENLRPLTREALQLIDDAPERYKKDFGINSYC